MDPNFEVDGGGNKGGGKKKPKNFNQGSKQSASGSHIQGQNPQQDLPRGPSRQTCTSSEQQSGQYPQQQQKQSTQHRQQQKQQQPFPRPQDFPQVCSQSKPGSSDQLAQPQQPGQQKPSQKKSAKPSRNAGGKGESQPEPKNQTQAQVKKEVQVPSDSKPQQNPKGKGLKAAAQQPIVQPPAQISQTLQTIQNKLAIPKRKNPRQGGKLGRATELEVNHLPLNLDKLFEKTVYHFDVAFTPDVPKKLLRNALEEFNRRHYPNDLIAFDGRKNMYSIKELKSKCDTVTITNDENNKTIDFNIQTKHVNTIFMKKIKEYLLNGSSNNPPQEAYQALDIVLKNRPFSLRFVNAGRSFFPIPRNIPVDLGEGMEMWKGFFQSPVIGWKPYLNIDVAHKGFPKNQKLTDYIYNDLQLNLNNEMDNRSLNSLTAYVKGLKVDFQIPNQPNTRRTYRVNNLFESATKFFFEIEDPNGKKQKMNVVQYYKNARNYVIQFPNLPCLHVGNPTKKTAIPIELCTVQKGQIRMKKLTENQTANMVRNAARPPSDRRANIENSIKDIKYNQDPVLKEFGIEVQEKFATVPARVLDQPVLSYHAQKEVKPRGGVWRADRFRESVSLNRWVVLNLDSRTRMDKIQEFERCLMQSGRDLNVNISRMAPVFNITIQRHWRVNDIEREVTFFFNKQKNNMDLIVVIIPDSPSGVYATVKQSSELQVGVLTQCIKSKTMFKMNPATAGNILLKINSKLNGINHILALKSCPPIMEGAIIFGADVTHPSPDQTAIPSVAAVAASHDIKGFQYNMEWRLQSPKVEIIQDLEDIVHKQLLKFKDHTKVIPKKILFFRDGVSEGQFMQLLENEFMAIRRACVRLNPNYTPAVTFVVVQKRHHTRMFPKHPADFDGKFGNVPSGTIVDTDITHPTELDFYLCSHASIQGTSRPTKYHLLWDDNKLTEDQLEQLTFYLCFMFARCTRSVSYPAPTYYAHLAAFRARAYIENKRIDLNHLDQEQDKNKLDRAFTINTPMFFV